MQSKQHKNKKTARAHDSSLTHSFSPGRRPRTWIRSTNRAPGRETRQRVADRLAERRRCLRVWGGAQSDREKADQAARFVSALKSRGRQSVRQFRARGLPLTEYLPVGRHASTGRNREG